MMSEPFSRSLKRFLKAGLLSFGGPAAQLEQLRAQYVTSGLVPEVTLARAISFCSILPGPESQQVATYLGWRVAGLRGAIAASTLYILPGWLLVTLASALYVAFGHTSVMLAVALGLRSAVVALLAESLWRQAKRVSQTPAVLLITLASIAARLAGIPFPLVMLTALIIGLVLPITAITQVSERTPIRWKKLLLEGLAAAALWLLPLGAALLAFGSDARVVAVVHDYTALSVSTWGGAYAVINVVIDNAVHQGWVTPTQMIDGLGLAESSPGPLLLTLCFVGFLAVGGPSATPIVSGILGSALAAWCLFMPSIVWIVLGAPIAEWLTQNPRVERAARFIAAAALGVIALVATYIMRQVVWPEGATVDAQWPVLVTVALCLAIHFVKKRPAFTLGLGVATALVISAVR